MHQSYVCRKLLAGLLAGALAVAGAAAHAAAPRMPTPKVSEANRKPLHDAQEALRARNYDEAAAKSKAVLAEPQKSRDDAFVAQSFLFDVARARNDQAGMMDALEGEIASGFLPPAGENAMYRSLVGMAYQQKNYKKAIDYGQQLLKNGDTSGDVYQWIGQAYYELKDYDAAVRFFKDLVDQTEKQGRKPDRNELILLQTSYEKAGNKAAAQATLEKIVRYYPDPKTWLVLLYDVKRERLDPRQKLLLYRLMDATGNLKQSQDYFDYAEAALAQGLPAESQQVLDTGLKANAFAAGPDRVRATRYVKSAATRADAQRAALGRLTSEAQRGQNGENQAALGTVLFSLGQYGKAIDALRTGLAKGNLQYEAYVRATLGLAQLKNGQKPDAAKTFRAIDSGDEITQRLAKLWSVYAS